MVQQDWQTQDLVGKDLSETTYNGIYAKGVNLAMVCLSKSQVEASNFVNAGFWKANLTHANFSGCNFSGANLAEAKLNHAVFTDCDFTMADLTAADLTNATFIRCSLVGANLSNATCTNLYTEAVNSWGVTGGANKVDFFATETELNKA